MANADNFIPTDEAVSCWRHDPLAAGKLKIGYVEVPGPSGGGSGLTPEFWDPTTWIGSYVRTNIHVYLSGILIPLPPVNPKQIPVELY